MRTALPHRSAVKLTIVALVLSLVATLAPRTTAGADEGDWENWCDTVVTNWFRPFLCDTLDIDGFSVDGLIDGFLSNGTEVQEAVCGLLSGVGSFAGVNVGDALNDICLSHPTGQLFDDIVDNVNIDEIIIGVISLDLGKIADGLNFCAGFANYDSTTSDVLQAILDESNFGELINDAFIKLVGFFIPDIGPLIDVQNFMAEFINWLDVGGIAESFANWIFVHLNIDNAVNGVAHGIAMVLDLIGLCSPQTVDLTIEKDLLDADGTASGPGDGWTFSVKGITDKCDGGAGPFEVTADELGEVTIPDVWAAANQGETCEYRIEEAAAAGYERADVAIVGGEIIETTDDYVIVTLDRRAEGVVVTFTNQALPSTSTPDASTTSTPGSSASTAASSSSTPPEKEAASNPQAARPNTPGTGVAPPPQVRGALAFTGAGSDALAAGGFLLLAVGLLALGGLRLTDGRRRH